MPGYTISLPPGRFGVPADAPRRPCLNESRPRRLCPADGTVATACVRECRRSLPRTAACTGAVVHGPVALHDLRTAHRPVEPARDGVVPEGAGGPALSL